MLHFTYPEIVSLASLSAIAAGPAGGAVILSYVHVRIERGHLTAHATDRYIAARVEFDLMALDDAEGEAESVLDLVVDAETLRKAAAASKLAPALRRTHTYPLVRLSEGDDGRLNFTVDLGDSFRSFPPRERLANKTAEYPAIWRLFPSERAHVHEIPASVSIDVTKLATLAKVKHPTDTLAGKWKSNTGGFRVSLSKECEDVDRPPAMYFTRLEGAVAILVQPIAAAYAKRGSL